MKYYSDKPISRPSDDKLGRLLFAQSLAVSIDNLSIASEGFVIGLTGEWGTGKSSVVELALRHLLYLEMERQSQNCLFGEDKPQPCSPEQLEVMFPDFEELEPHVKPLENLDLEVRYWERTNRINEFTRILKSKDRAATADRFFRLRQLARLSPRVATVRFAPWNIAGRSELAKALFSDIARAAGHVFGDPLRKSFANVLQRLAEVAPVTAASLNTIGVPIIGGMLSALEGTASKVASNLTQGQTLDELLRELRNCLSDLGERRILVIIDDIDRLLPDEMVEIISLVKSLGDLPNVVYLLVYDEERLLSGLKRKLCDPKRYIEKIVQHTVAMPLLEANAVSNLFDIEFAAVIGELSPADVPRAQHLWFNVLRKYLNTPRDVKRLINGYRWVNAGMKEYSNPVDLLAIEALRIFEPGIHGWVRRNIGELVG